MNGLKVGDRVTVEVTGRRAFNGIITGEGMQGPWWLVRKDGTKWPVAYSKSFCRPEDLSLTSAQGTQE